MKIILLACVVSSCLAKAQALLTPPWVELGPEGGALVRVVVGTGATCPQLRVNGRALLMQIREPLPEGLKPVCQATLPREAHAVALGKQHLKLPRTPERVVAIGDTGCRVKGGQIQACNDPSLWPFAAVARQAARLKPDLIVHVGDYLYRETACPAVVQGCAGPHGDNWEAWNADFFAPVRDALPAAPWIFARGNHESCERSFRGWFYYLDPRSFDGGCTQYSEPYVTNSGTLRIGVLDTGSTKDVPHAEPAQIPIYSRELAELSNKVYWIVDHHPFWGYTVNERGLSATDLTLGPAWAEAKPEGVTLVLSGHVHLFEFLALEDGRPDQVIAGDSGTQLDTGFTVDKSGSSVHGARVRAGEVNMGFGLTELERKGPGWQLTLHTAEGATRLHCDIAANGTASCRPEK